MFQKIVEFRKNLADVHEYVNAGQLMDALLNTKVGTPKKTKQDQPKNPDLGSGSQMNSRSPARRVTPVVERLVSCDLYQPANQILKVLLRVVCPRSHRWQVFIWNIVKSNVWSSWGTNGTVPSEVWFWSGSTVCAPKKNGSSSWKKTMVLISNNLIRSDVCHFWFEQDYERFLLMMVTKIFQHRYSPVQVEE